MKRECHVRFCESGGVRLPSATRLMTLVLSGTVITKKDLLRNFGSLHDKLESFENGPVDVQVFGNVAVAYGSVSEKRLRDGKDSSGEFVGSISWRIETANGWWSCAQRAPGRGMKSSRWGRRNYEVI